MSANPADEPDHRPHHCKRRAQGFSVNAAADRQQDKSEQDRAVWDNLNVHKSHDMRAFVAAQPWLEVAYLPPYAPELNPVEGLWAT